MIKTKKRSHPAQFLIFGGEGAAVGHPEKSLIVKTERRGVRSGAEAVAAVVAEFVVLSGGERLLDGDGGGGCPTAFMKKIEAVLRLHG
jgi:hypothetical protein